MKINVMGAVFVLWAGCAGSADPAPSDDGAGGPGSQRLAVGADGAGLEEQLIGASEERPCGERTVAGVELPNGNRLAWCVLPNGSELVIERGRIGDSPIFGPRELRARRPACGLELYLGATPASAAVPRALVDACPGAGAMAALAARSIVAGALIEPLVAAPTSHATSPNYCNFSDSKFQAERCYECSPYDDCYDWCVPQHWGWHDRTMSAFLGEEANIAVEVNASCQGSTRLRGWHREDVGDYWGAPEYDFYLSAGHWTTTALIYHSVGIFGQDYDLRLRADSNAGAYHQHSGYFLDE
jgi:hypothetical protein